MLRTLKNLSRSSELRSEDLRSTTDKATGGGWSWRRDARLFHESLEFESITEVLNGPAARTN